MTGPLPRFFVSVASKGLRIYVSGLESTLAGISIGVDSKWLNGKVGELLADAERALTPRMLRRFTRHVVYQKAMKSQRKSQAVGGNMHKEKGRTAGFC
jgi:hypothetical protein